MRGGESNAWSSGGSLEVWHRLLPRGGGWGRGRRKELAGPRGVNSSQALAQRGCHAAAPATAMILAEEPGLLPDGQNSWLPGENSWPSPSFLRTEAEPQRRIAPHLGSWERRAWPRGRGWFPGVGVGVGWDPWIGEGVGRLLEQRPRYARSM